MTPNDDLCPCQDETRAGCCAQPMAPVAAPVKIDNPPGQSAIRYRAGTFASFRRAMLNDMADKAESGTTNPFALWREGASGDYQTLFFELWAYLADVLTFYQERIANEAFLQTATQPDSLLRLCQLINYHPAPGAAASGLLAFTVEKDKTVDIPAGFRTSNKPPPGGDPAVFETSSAITASGSYSAIPLASTALTNQFAALTAYMNLLLLDSGASPGSNAASDVYNLAGNAFAQSLVRIPALERIHAWMQHLAEVDAIVEIVGPATMDRLAALAPILAVTPDPDKALRERPQSQHPISGFESRVAQRLDIRMVVLSGTNNRLTPGDFVLLVQNASQPRALQSPSVIELDDVVIDKATNSTTIFWTEEDPAKAYEDVALCALRVQARFFGNNAPDWNTLSSNLTQPNDGPFKDYWDDPRTKPNPLAVDRTKFPDKDADKSKIALDSQYSQIKANNAQDWLLLRYAGGDDTFHVTGVETVTITDYTLTLKVSRLSIFPSMCAASVYPLRETLLLTGAELLPLQNNLPLPQAAGDFTLLLEGLYPLPAGRNVFVRGKTLDLNTLQVSDDVTTEVAVLANDASVDRPNNLTTIELTQALQNVFVRAGTVVLANVVSATQGETVKDEVLGNGDGSAFQTFDISKKPVTYVPGASPDGLSAVSSTLQVNVNGVLWDEKPTLLQSTPDAQEFTTDLDATGQRTVIFGDGVNGAKPPAGKDNVHARYRKGMGTNGNVDADAVTQMLDMKPGLQKVTNPQPTFGGVDQESMDRIRVNAPASLRIFGRAVSVEDYAALALSYPGVLKAGADWIERDPVTGRGIAQPYIRLTIVPTKGTTLAGTSPFGKSLRAFLDSHRDPNVALRLSEATPVHIKVNLTIDVDDRYPQGATTAAVLAALSPNQNPGGPPGYFASERLRLGQSLYLSDLYGTVQGIEGVRDVVVTLFRRVTTDPQADPVNDNILIAPTELAVLSNSAADPAKDLVTYHSGGFPDT